ncbi:MULTISPECIES: radical SAM protein [unclassified Agarivorans]|uniref:radical SAM protein n=1 Tax=unclassified Agarivorans TaxID=2636026 RepID=UPI0026E315C1|nr:MULTISPECIES: radical SAM protein [unclassified Agarivorans]MDO6684604.1 radical SAM protein [Agarivorans sp. 3_MG-2023]MDO6714769.1 radical SAM protein [Agarivorans sp. 2_MG-2023]
MSITSSSCHLFEKWAKGGPSELVYFCFPRCDGDCQHCWSHNVYLGRKVPADWHEDFWKNVDSSRLSSIKLSGGETFLYKELPHLIEIIRQNVGNEVPIKLLTSGRPFVSLLSGEDGIEETLSAMKSMGLQWDNLEIHLSADEHHANSWKRVSSIKYSEDLTHLLPNDLLVNAVRNFLGASSRLKFTHPTYDGKLKIHTAHNRLSWHRNALYHWIDDSIWKEAVDSTEGLIDSGRASQNGIGEKYLHSGTSQSIFIIPGTSFSLNSTSPQSERYVSCDGRQTVYLNPSKNKGSGSCVLGWWNLINRHFCGGPVSEALRIIGKT